MKYYMYLYDIDENCIHGFLDTTGLPDPDLLIRTCNEQRISNFLLWQLAYTEFYFTPVAWPDFSKEELENMKRLDEAESKAKAEKELNEILQ